MRLLTIATSSHLPLAALLLQSVAQVHPDWQRFLLLADVTRAGLRQREKEGMGVLGELLCCADLGIADLDIMRRYYDALEFCCALKIYGLTHLLQEGDSALFLDSDMLILDRLDSIVPPAGKFLVTPHARLPMPQDGHGPDDRELCMSGFINGGVLGAGAGSDKTAAALWLRGHMRAHCFQAPGYGMYSDQLWLQSMTGYFPETVSVCRDPAINAAYWNLHERRLSAGEGAVRLQSGAPLALFHFSGYPGDGQISRLSARRFDKDTEAALAALSARYGSLLDEARRRFRPYQGDLGFASAPLEQRIAMAQAEWNDPELILPQRGGVVARVGRRLKRLTGGS